MHDNLFLLFHRWAVVQSRSGEWKMSPPQVEALSYFELDQAADLRDFSTTHRGKWLLKVRELEQFAERYGHLPRRDSARPRSGNEQELAHFVSRQRHLENDLNIYQAQRLEAIPNWDWEPQRTEWHRTAKRWRDFLIEHGRHPRRRGSELDESALAEWVARQHRRLDLSLIAFEEAPAFRHCSEWATAYLRK